MIWPYLLSCEEGGGWGGAGRDLRVRGEAGAQQLRAWPGGGQSGRQRGRVLCNIHQSGPCITVVTRPSMSLSVYDGQIEGVTSVTCA